MQFTNPKKQLQLWTILQCNETQHPLSASSLQRTLQLDGVALEILTRSVPAPAQQGPLARLIESYPLNECLDQHLLLALDSGGCMDSSFTIMFFVMFLNYFFIIIIDFLVLWMQMWPPHDNVVIECLSLGCSFFL